LTIRTSEIASLPASAHELALGIEGFTYSDLYDPQRLSELCERFYAFVEQQDPTLSEAYARYRQNLGQGLTPPQESELLIKLAPHLSVFVARLFDVEVQVEALRQKTIANDPIFAFRKEFIQRRVLKRLAKGEKAKGELPSLQAQISLLSEVAFFDGTAEPDAELRYARMIVELLRLEQAHARPAGPDDAARQAVSELRAHLSDDPRADEAFADLLGRNGHTRDDAPTPSEPLLQRRGDAEGASAARVPTSPPTRVGGSDGTDDLAFLRELLALCEEWALALAEHQSALPDSQRWVSFWQPEPMQYQQLVKLNVPAPEFSERFVGPEETRRKRDGFKLTDPRMTRKEALGHVDYCLYCHPREKDSCSKGFREKDGSYRKNPLGVPLEGCPLDEKISEMHVLEKAGDTIAALAMCMIDNPMCPGTGHRICNDCMKACIFQKQTPVNIPQIETRLLTDVVYELPWGFEIYSLLTRWNPLNVRRPCALPYNGKNMLIVGVGPAGYTLAHYLMNEGFAVVGIDGLKIEPLPKHLTGDRDAPPTPVKWYKDLYEQLDERILLGFGGVSEYGITVRWDKNFLAMVYLTLARRDKFKLYGGVRFGGTLEIDDAWELGFDHIAIATGAGRPTIIDMKNNLIRGIRKASDFLMALQLTGAYKMSAMANLQMRLPAIVIGGGLTGIDTATEMMAYYPQQVEKTLHRFETLRQFFGADRVLLPFSAEEREILMEQVEHGRAIRAERAAAKREGRAPDFAALIRQWGGVKLVYRKTLQDSPAYRLNHEEVIKALEEGIEFVQCHNPLEAHPDKHGALESVTFEVMAQVEKKWRPTAQKRTLPCRTLCVAAGTHPNSMYEKEHPGTFQRDKWGEFFLGYRVQGGDPNRDASRLGTPSGLRVQDAPSEPTRGGVGPNGDDFRFPISDFPFDVDGDGENRKSQIENRKFQLVPAEPGDRDAFFTSYEKNGRFISYYGDNHPVYEGNVVKAMASAKKGFPRVVALFVDELAKMRPQDQPQREAAWRKFTDHLDGQIIARVAQVVRLTPTIVEVIVHAPLAARKFHPGQFYRLQNYEVNSPNLRGTKLTMEGIALTGAWKDDSKGLLSLIVLEMGVSSRLCAMLQPGEPVVCMGPTGAPTHIPENQTVLLAGGGLGNAVLFSIAKALKARNCRVLYFAGYKSPRDVFKPDEIEAGTDQVVWSVDDGEKIKPRRPQDLTFRGNIVQAMDAYGKGELWGAGVPPAGLPRFSLAEIDHIIAIGSDRMMRAVKEARHGVLAAHFRPDHTAIASINSPMQCMMKEICAQCLQKHVDPKTGEEKEIVFSCFNQDQPLDTVDFNNLNDRLRQNTMQEKLSNMWLDYLLEEKNVLLV
jgi:NADPH-dependent glutamate synthase beta subunit-like oxidoreductase/NAD(P)H-flavin reductase